MRIVFRRRAEADLRGIAWFDRVAPDSVQRFLDDIYRSIVSPLFRAAALGAKDSSHLALPPI